MGTNSSSLQAAFSGDYENWKNRNPCFVKGNSVTLQYTSLSNVSSWGVMCFVRALSEIEFHRASSDESICNIRKQFGNLNQVKYADWTFWETPHPYDNGSKIEKVIRFPGAKNLYIVFDPKTRTELNYDKFTICEGCENQDKKVLDGVSGSLEAFKSKNPIKIPGDSFNFKFFSDESAGDWGIRMYIYRSTSEEEETLQWDTIADSFSFQFEIIKEKFAVVELKELPKGDEDEKKDDEKKEEILEADLDLPKWKVWETSHPYLSGIDCKDVISFPRAQAIIIVFDPMCKLEKQMDFLKFYKKKEDQSPLWTGTGQTFPRIWRIDGDSFVIHFLSDNSFTDWGIRLFLFPLSKTTDGLPKEHLLPAFLSQNYDQLKSKVEVIPFSFSPFNESKEAAVSKPALIDVKSLLSRHDHNWYNWCSVKPSKSNIGPGDFELKVDGAKRIVLLMDPRCDFPGSTITVSYSCGDERKEILSSTVWDKVLLNNPMHVIPANNLQITLNTPGTVFNGFGLKFYFYVSKEEELESLPWSEYPKAFSNSDDLLIGARPTESPSVSRMEIQKCNRFDITAWETPHPVYAGSEIADTVVVEGASKLVVTFDPDYRRTVQSDTLSVHKGSTVTKDVLYRIPEQSADSEAIIVSGDTVSFKFCTGALASPGVKFVVRGLRFGDYSSTMHSIFEPISEHVEKVLKPKSQEIEEDFLGEEWRIWETKHNYPDNLDETYTREIPGASKLLLVFDPMTKTEKNYDWLKLFQGKGDAKVPLLGGAALSGEFADFAEKDPIEVEGNCVSFHFHSDTGVNYWGVRVYIKGIFDKPRSPTIVDDEEKFSVFHRPLSDIPITVRDKSLFPLQVVMQALKYSGMCKRSSKRIGFFEKQILDELHQEFKSRTKREIGPFGLQPHESAIQCAHNLAKMLLSIHATRIVAACVPDLSAKELAELDIKYKRRYSMVLKMIWACERHNRQFAG
eukprot:TRINITY_DN29436_c0_g1_i1.p1 TRINITY_DN29436_c0_g1~~TRINITY_DN29436_c0_g1_i1.p1  ORF type:complete len:1110 (+),score=286.23 TRINITY_DN29436_c0_g1_i1:447-3332(+)